MSDDELIHIVVVPIIFYLSASIGRRCRWLAIEYQGYGHYQGTAAARDAVKKEALRKARVRYIAVTPESGTEDMAREILRLAQVERLKPNTFFSDGDRETRRAKNAGH